MSLTKLSEKDRDIILQCLNAVAKGNFLEHEHHSRLGLELSELEQITVAYPEIDDTNDDSNETLAINNCLNEVSYGIRFTDGEWNRWFTVNREEVVEVYRKWAKLRGWERSGII